MAYSYLNKYDADNLVEAAHSHFTNDLGFIPTPADVLEYIYRDFDQDIFTGETSMAEYTKDFRDVQAIMIRLGLEYGIE